MPRRQQGRSYLGVIDYDSGSVSLLDIPFSDLSNVIAGDDYFYIEGASASIPMSIAKVYQKPNAYFWLFVDDVINFVYRL
jgi:hypothetical protein